MVLEAFGNKLKFVRENQGISQQRLSSLTGVVREQISRIENGLINPTLETMHKLSMALDIQLKDLLDFEIVEYTNNIDFNKIKPFVKWAGGKTQIMDKIKAHMPIDFNTYYEPFLGGGAVLFNLVPNKAVISDYNKELIMTYKCFGDTECFNLMNKEILKHENNHNELYYYEIRELDRKDNYNELPVYVKAARLIYLNKACFNGLYRVNSKGYFNVPSGKKAVVKAYNKELFDELNKFLSNPNVKIMQGDFAEAVKTAKRGDFVYFDPPYDTLDDKASFTSYTKDDFGRDEQVRLFEVFKELDSRGVLVMLSNHNTQFINDLYKDFNINIIEARRNINSNANGRGKIEEVIITNYRKE